MNGWIDWIVWIELYGWMNGLDALYGWMDRLD
jgi:hypothetical protein